MLKTLKLYGDLADFIGHKEFEVVLNNPIDAIRFLLHNFAGVEKYMSDKYYKVIVDGQELGEEELEFPIGNSEVSLVPVITGAGGRGFGKILLGALLIGLSFGFPMTLGSGSLTFGKGFVASFKTASFLSKSAFYLGSALMLGGVQELLFPLPEAPEIETDPRLSFSFSGIQNTARPGTTLPVVYGEITTGSVVISASVDTNQIQVETE
tara:strand:- start:8248 stop:8874 length:627 start_codon:yes stop_codon:yes gene_type:complete